MIKKTLSRRKFVQMTILGTGSLSLLCMCKKSQTNSSWHFFTGDEAQTIIAIAEQFIPADKDPGATYANVVNFIDKQLVGPYTRFQDEYRKGLACLAQSCRSLHNGSFASLEGTKQSGFLELMEKGRLPKEHWDGVNQGSFFSRLLDHTMQGFYGSPRHGGNRDYVSYKMMKLDYPHVLGQNRYATVIQEIKNQENEK